MAKIGVQGILVDQDFSFFKLKTKYKKSNTSSGVDGGGGRGASLRTFSAYNDRSESRPNDIMM